jgi:UDP-N-acetylmuramoyl-tripeptide--D-alanyl-D-alanine ligase
MAEGALKSGMKEDSIFSFSDSEETADHIESLLRAGDLVLVKGSRGMKTDRVVKRLGNKGN